MPNDSGVGSVDDPESSSGDGSVIAILKRQRTLLVSIAAAVAVFAGLVLVNGSVPTAPATATAAAPTYGEGTTVKLSTDLAGNLRTSGGGGGGNPAGGWLDSVRRVGRMDSLTLLRSLDSGRKLTVVDSLRSVGRVLADSAFLARWFGSTAPTVGQKAMAASIPVVVASDQSAVATTGGAADSVQLRTGQKHAGRVAVDSILANMTHIGRVAVDSILASMTHIGRVAVDSILANMTHIGRTAVDSILANQTHIGRVSVDTIQDRGSVSTGGTIGAVQLGSSLGKTNVLLTGSLTTTATTADQVVLTRTVTAGKTFYLQYVDFEARLTTQSATASILGTISLETPSGTKVITHSLVNGTTEYDDQVHPFTFSEPIPIAAAVVVRCVTTPAAATSMLWICNFGGYEK